MGGLNLTGYIPGAIGRVSELHASYYSKHWGFGLYFESKVATELSEFLTRFEEQHDGFWLAITKGEIIGSVAIDGAQAAGKGAHLRWFIVAEDRHGSGIGNALISRAVDFCRQAGFSSIYLWTFAGLDAARHLYEKHGFRLIEEHEGDQWGVRVTEQRFELCL
jgi:N-acetylglutamate synthase-like GNAT family acetyltransferase